MNPTEYNQDFNSNLPAIRKADFKGKQVHAINSWELFQKLGLSNYSVWCHDQILTQGEEGLDFIFVVSSDLNRRGRSRNEYQLSIDFTKHLVLQSKSEFGKMYRKYLIKFEDDHRDKVVKLSQTPEAAKFFSNYLESFKQISTTAYQTMGAKISKEVFGIEVPQHFLPQVDEPRWSAEEIGKKINKSCQVIGRATTMLGLKNEKYAIQRLTVAKYTNKEVPMWYYNQEAVNIINRYFNESK